jgi:hypothetical protein
MFLGRVGMKRAFWQWGLQLMLWIFFAACPAYCTDYYVDPNGNDSNDGLSIDHPFKTIGHAEDMAVAGDTIYVRGGTYTYSSGSPAINLPSKSGASDTNRCYLMGYNGERPLLDFSSMPDGSADGLKISGSYWYVYGMDFKGAPHNGIQINAGTYNIVEFCRSYENRNSGIQLKNGAAHNQIINCDSYYNFDAPGGGNADGFAPKGDVGTDNYFYGCRSWQNSDDGYDGYPSSDSNVTTTYEDCWSFKNGYLRDANSSIHGNGSGFKMGGNYYRHNVIYKKCLCFNNYRKGFDQNHDYGSMTLYNCTSYSNGANNYKIYEQPTDHNKTATVTNCISAGTGGMDIRSWVVQTTDSWQSPFVVTDADFASIDPNAAYGPRNADGSLPSIAFMRLANDSDLIDGGTDVGLPYNGSAPDLGAFEHIDGDCQPDGNVDWADLECLALNWLDSDCGTCNGANFDGIDGVDFYDFAIMAENWLK